MKLSTTFIVALIALLVSQKAPAQTHAVLKPSDPVKIELKVPAEDAANVSSIYTVSEKGLLRMPYLDHEIQASGLSVAELSRRIEAAYRSAGIYTNPTVVAGLGGPEIIAPHVATVGGEVRNPREVPLREKMRLYSAIMSAGGFTEFADVRRVKLIRESKATFYDLRNLREDGGNNPVLKDGDLIHVPAD